MKSDDPRLLEARKSAEERVNRMDDLTLYVIKGQWAIEQAVTQFLLDTGGGDLRGFCKRGKRCADTLKDPEGKQAMQVMWAAYSLRNELAHSRSEEQINAKMVKLRNEYMQYLSPEQAEGLKDVSDEIVAYQACIAVAGLLYVEGENRKK
jgi:hypothetical protein